MKNIIISLFAVTSLIFGSFGISPVLAQTTPLAAVFLAPTNNQSLTVNQAFTFQGSATGGEAPYAFLWNFGDGTDAGGASFAKTYTATGAKTVLLTVTDFSGAQANTSIVINVNDPATPTAPTVDLKINNSNGPVSLLTGASANLSWTSSDATTCTASGAWSGSKSVNSTESTGALNTVGAFTYTLTCTGAGGSANDSVTVNVSAPTSASSVDLKVNGSNGPATVTVGGTASLTWTSSNATACVASGAWTGSRSSTGSDSTGALNTVGALTYTLTCTGSEGSVSDSVTVNVQTAGNPAAPVISNIRVTDVTETSAIVRWTTDIVADSRVIYDTVSHPTLGSAPNFGYVHSSDTFHSSPKVTEHAVTLTGLSASTQYFYRVLSQP